MEIDKLLEQYRDNIAVLRNMHPELFNCLQKGHHIVSIQCDEWKEVLSRWEKEDHSKHKFTMTINPTLNCNMRCWYCYEQHNKSAYMSDTTIQSVKKFIQKKVAEPELKGLNIDFFGGEPLLHYNKCVYPILDSAYTECEQQGKQLYISFTTNAYLLSETILSDLDRYAKWGQIRMQITLDGNEEFHNKTRTLGGIQPTFRQIVSNIYDCVRHNMNVLVRLNYTKENIISFYDLIDEFSTLSTHARKNLTFCFQKVWQELTSIELEKNVEMLQEAFCTAGFSVNFSDSLNGIRCYGDRDNFIVINYNGDLYKCTAREFLPVCREGVLTDDGDLLWNSKYRQRMALKSCPKICHQCILFPLCHAGCTQNKLESSLKENECMRRYTEEQKKRLLENKIEHQLKYKRL